MQLSRKIGSGCPGVPRTASGKISVIVGLSTQSVYGHFKIGAPKTIDGYIAWKKQFDEGKKSRRAAAMAKLRLEPEEKRRRAYIRRKEYNQRPEVKARGAARGRANRHKEKARYHADIEFRLSKCIRKAHRKLALGEGKTSRHLGCDWRQLRAHLESQFKGCMSWGNYGSAWEIDHIHPLASFNKSDPAQRAIASHYTNLKPEWRRTNRRKQDKITIPQLPLLLPA